MIIKKFQGKTSEEALDAAKKELGDNIVILTERNVKPKWYQFWRQSQVEVTVAKEEEAETVMARQSSSIAQAVAEINSLRSSQEEKEAAADKAQEASQKPQPAVEDSALNEKLDTIQNLLEEKWKQQEKQAEKAAVEGKEPEQSAEGDKQEESSGEIESFLKLLHDTMTDNEVNREYADQMIDEVRKNMREDMDMEYILSQIYQKMILKFGKAECITPSQGKGPKVIYFVGPTGVGKTTTLAKLASQLSVMEGRKIALFTADTYRISAADQSKTYANIMNVPFHIIYSVDEMRQKFELYKDYDYILVDTAGHSHHNEEQLKTMSEFLHAFDETAEKEVFLVLSATTKYRDLVSIAETYKTITDYKIIFTKLDETSACGNMLNLRIHTMAALSYVTCGQNVPDDIAKFDPQDTVKKLLSTEE